MCFLLIPRGHDFVTSSGYCLLLLFSHLHDEVGDDANPVLLGGELGKVGKVLVPPLGLEGLLSTSEAEKEGGGGGETRQHVVFARKKERKKQDPAIVIL